jgi:hypothetical protein
MAKMTNRHPADRLHDVREAIKALRGEEASSKAEIIAEGKWVGAEYTATLTDQVRSVLDRDKLEKALGKAEIAKHTKVQKIEMLRLHKRSDVFG